MMRNVARAGLFTLLLLSAGCPPMPPPKEVLVEYKPLVTADSPGPEIEVYVVGVDENNIHQFRNMKISEFFQVDESQTLRGLVDSQRIGKQFVFTSKKTADQVISPDDPIRKTWKDNGAKYLLIIQNFPRPLDDSVTAEHDPAHYRELPLDDQQWPGSELVISVGIADPYIKSTP